MTRHVRLWGGNGYPEEDTGPITDAERAQLARRRELEPPDAGRRGHRKPNTEARHCVGLEGTSWE